MRTLSIIRFKWENNLEIGQPSSYDYCKSGKQLNKNFLEATMATGKKAASDAAKILRNPKSTKKEKEVAASDLAQRKGVAKTKPKTK